MIVKNFGSRIEATFGAQFVAEGLPEQPIRSFSQQDLLRIVPLAIVDVALHTSGTIHVASDLTDTNGGNIGSKQGTLRQIIKNSNAISDVNKSWFQIPSP